MREGARRLRARRTSWMAALVWLALGLPPVWLHQAPLPVAADEPRPPRPEIATFVGSPLGGRPTEVAQQPFGVAVSGRQTYVADPVNHLVRLLIDRTEFAFAGNGGLSVEGDGGEPSRAQLAGPYAVAPGRTTQLGLQVTGFDTYIADTFGHQVRKVSVTIPPIDSQKGAITAVIKTVAGSGAFGFSGDGGPAVAAKLNSPYGIAWDPAIDTVYVADTLNNRIRAVRHDGSIDTVVGTGAAGFSADETAPLKVALNQPRGLALDGRGRLYIADTFNQVVRLYDPSQGSVTIVAGTGGAGFTDGVVATSARLRQPAAVAVDPSGTLYVADAGNHIVRQVGSDRVIHTVAGNGTPGFSGDDGPGTRAQLRAPFGVAVRPDGDLVIADTGNNYLRLLDASPSPDGNRQIHRLAGNGTPSFAGDGRRPGDVQLAGPSAALARLSSKEAADPSAPISGDRYVLDTFNHAVRSFSTGKTVRTMVGTGGAAGPPDRKPDGSLREGPSHLAYPMGMALDSAGANLYIADTFNNLVRKVELAKGNVTTVAGDGTAGFGGDGDLATSAQLSHPTGVAVDRDGNVFIADAYNGRVRRVDTLTHDISTVAGTGRLGFTGDAGPATRADLYLPHGVALDSAKPPNLYITDTFNHRVRKVDGSTGAISTVAGDGVPDFGDGQVATQAHLNRPWSAVVDSLNLYIADFLNHRVRKVDHATRAMSTLAGMSTPGLKGDAGPADTAEVGGPRGVNPIGATGAVLVADSFNDRIRWVGVTQAGVFRTRVDFEPTNLSRTSSPQTVTVSSTGSGLLVLGAIEPHPASRDFVVPAERNGCSRERLEPGTRCTFEVAFQPRGPGSRGGTVVIADDAQGNPHLVSLLGKATAPIVRLSAPNLSFSQPPGRVGPPQTLTLTNVGDGPLNIDGIQVAGGEFAQTNSCPPVVVPNASCVITVNFKQVPSGIRSSSLTVEDDAPGSPQAISLFGALAVPGVSLIPASLAFNQNLGGSSRAQVVTLVNNGNAPLTLTGIREFGDFVQTNNCPAQVAVNASCTIRVTFVPSARGVREGQVLLADDATDSPQKLNLVGIGTLPSAGLTPDELRFNQNVGTTSPSSSVTLENRGDGPLTIGGITATGGYAKTTNCPHTVAPHDSCTINVTFTPAAAGPQNGSLIVTTDSDGLAGSQQTVRLVGAGLAPAVRLAPTLLRPRQNVGGQSPPETVTLTNTGDGVLTIRDSRTLRGAFRDYAIASECDTSIGPGDSCTLTVTFKPQAAGPRQATLLITDDAGGNPHEVRLEGFGTVPRAELSSKSLNFGSVGRNTTRLAPPVILASSGNGPLTIRSIGPPTGSFSLTNNCPGVLAPGAICLISVAFNPTVAGPLSGQVTISTDAGTQIVELHGTGA